MMAFTMLVMGAFVFILWGPVDGVKTRFRYRPHDALFIARCEARCWLTHNKSSCVKSCLLKGFNKPGWCPKNTTTLSPFATVCLEACRKDSECPALHKCCRHNCGVTCQPAEDLFSAVEVPDIPNEIKVKEGIRKKIIYISWKQEQSASRNASSVVYVIEERHHAGRNFIEKRLSDWSACALSFKTNYILRNFAKPGRWYQFQVAAVNENGTKGFSEPSATFSVSTTPKPPKAPENVTVGPVSIRNGSLNAELRWIPPASDLPIQKYKVFWSRRLHGATALDSVLVHQQIISKDFTTFLLQNLQPNSLYFLQVQALVQFGKDRLKGEKSGLVLNTTNYVNETTKMLYTNSSSKTSVKELQLQKLFWGQGDLRARISWTPIIPQNRYTVSWWTGPCHRNFKTYGNFKFAATTKASHFDLYDLQFNCRYKVNVRDISNEGKESIQDTSITFTTPTCSLFRLHYKKIRCSALKHECCK